MSLIMIEQLKTQEEVSLNDTILDLTYSHADAQALDDNNLLADDVLHSFTENELDDQEERETLESTGAQLLVGVADLTEMAMAANWEMH